MSILKLTSDTLVGTPATGNIEYNGQFFGTDSNNSRAQMQRLVQATSQTASGTSIDFTGIPAWAKKITVMINGVSTNGTSIVQVQIGDAGGIETTGYTGSAVSIDGSIAGLALSAGFLLADAWAATIVISGILTITNVGSNLWVASFVGGRTDGNGAIMGGSKTLSDVLTQVRITTVNGTDTFDAGTINIIYEG